MIILSPCDLIGSLVVLYLVLVSSGIDKGLMAYYHRLINHLIELFVLEVGSLSLLNCLL